MSDKIRVVIKAPGTPACTTFINNDLKTYQSLVGGYIEAVGFGSDTMMLINEEGKLQNLELNFKLNYEAIVGTAVFVRIAGEDFTDLGEAEANNLCYFIDEILAKEPEDLPF